MDDMDAAARERRRFFERPASPREMRITVRDIELLRNISRLRLASGAQLAALDGGSAQNVSRSLLALFENGYVERPVAQVTTRFLYKGSRPTIYGLTRKGAALLRKHGADVRRRLLDGIDKERGAGWRFIEHTVAVSEFLVSLELALKDRTDVRLLERGEILEDAPKSKRDRLVKLEASIRIGGSLRKNAAVPDALFGLRFDDETESYFMLEIDRGEMPVERYKNTYRTYFAKKMLTYLEASRQQRHIHDLGLPNFRVLTVTTDQTRIEKMLSALNVITEGRGSNMFLFTDQATISASNPLSIEWMSGKRVRLRLTD
ncbi:MAG TPA: replication-relaxation family protein [Pseudolabrys sp.]|nr:replication-relaxation family protein [Pseudolabrys sp.]